MLTKDKLPQYYVVDAQGCWIWQGVKNAGGYGRFSGTTAHRVAWRLYKGVIPCGQEVLHTCDIPACVNPEHLFLGTQKDNLQDMAIKGRHGLSKITAAAVPVIRVQLAAAMHFKSKYQACCEIGGLYGVSRGAMESILDNRSWTHA